MSCCNISQGDERVSKSSSDLKGGHEAVMEEKTGGGGWVGD